MHSTRDRDPLPEEWGLEAAKAGVYAALMTSQQQQSYSLIAPHPQSHPLPSGRGNSCSSNIGSCWKLLHTPSQQQPALKAFDSSSCGPSACQQPLLKLQDLLSEHISSSQATIFLI